MSDSDVTIKTAAILFVDDEESILTTLKRFMRHSQYECFYANSGAEALHILETHTIDVVVSDMKMPQMTGEQLLREVARRYPETIRIVLSAFSEDDLVMGAINEGRIWGFIHKPWNNNELKQALDQAVFTQQIVAERALLKRTLHRYEAQYKEAFQGFIGRSMPMQFVYNTIEKAAASRASVFITGESGTGKEVAARALHDLSGRCDKPFIALNCAAIPGELMESEIFGHIKGAFSGASSDRDGAASLSDGGTLFLDELAEMDITLQSKLLRFIQTGTFQKVGSGRTEQVDIRFVCATNRAPLEAIENKQLREDLYYRLNVISITLPPLREREQDAFTLAQAFVKKFSDMEQKVVVGLSSDAEAFINAYPWPGNVRQLENAMHSAVVMSNGPLLTAECVAAALGLNKEALSAVVQETAAHETRPSPNTGPAKAAPVTGAEAPASIDDIKPLAETEKEAIKQAIELCEGNIVRAASVLEVSPSTLYRKMQSWQDAS